MLTLFSDLIHYTVHREEPLPPFSAQGYEYITAGNGLFLRAENQYIAAVIRLAKAQVRGLPPLIQSIRPKHARLPGRLLSDIAANMTRISGEAMYYLVQREGQIKVMRPAQQGSQVAVNYRSDQYAAALADIHSHGSLTAFFSPEDDRDEQGFRWYMVVGLVYDQPEIRLRLGVYGYHIPLPITTLFEDSGGLRDAYAVGGKSPWNL